MSRLQNCPVCGRIPKIHIYDGYRTSNKDNLIRATKVCTIRCKRLFGKPHLEVTSNDDDWAIAETNAHNNWNNEVNRYNKIMCVK